MQYLKFSDGFRPATSARAAECMQSEPDLATARCASIRAALIAVRQAADVICDRWSLALISVLLEGEHRFSSLMARTGTASRLLTARLRTLERNELISRAPYALRPTRHHYRLTEMGAALTPVIVQMAEWERNWTAGAPRNAERLLHLICGRSLHARLTCANCGGSTGARDIDLKFTAARAQSAPDRQTSHRLSTLRGAVHSSPMQLLVPILDIFGDKWGIEIIVCAFFRVTRFGDFRNCAGIAANILSDRLERLVSADILTRNSKNGGQVGYWLTEKGVDLYPIVVSIQTWADAWLRPRYYSPVGLIHRACGEVFRPLTTCSGCGQAVRCADLGFEALIGTERPPRP